MNLKNKNVVVVGATGGIGRVMSLAFALKGSNVILVGRDRKILSSLDTKLKERGCVSQILAVDVTKPAGVDKLSKLLRHGHIDVIVHAAGVGIYKSLESLTFDEWKKSFDVNVNSVFLVIKHLLPLLKKAQEGYVLVTGSGMGKLAVAKRSAYCASKFALRGFIMSLAKEYKGTGINFVHLTLGSVLTSFGPLTLEEKVKKVKEGKSYITPAYLAHTVVTKLENGSLKTETPVYPRKYFSESKSGKT